MKKVFCKYFGHNVDVVKTNDYQIPTHERCSFCGLERKMKRDKDSNCLHWHYSDGRISVGYTAFRVDDVIFGELS